MIFLACSFQNAVSLMYGFHLCWPYLFGLTWLLTRLIKQSSQNRQDVRLHAVSEQLPQWSKRGLCYLLLCLSHLCHHGVRRVRCGPWDNPSWCSLCLQELSLLLGRSLEANVLLQWDSGMNECLSDHLLMYFSTAQTNKAMLLSLSSSPCSILTCSGSLDLKAHKNVAYILDALSCLFP